ncbi:LPXTG cell wall anchor domain-containing protein [Bacillus sp. JCM 19034]|nr:LPXTG cell wall anchor domain-containing protein [Bacillus sp. JCM 19034]
MKIDEVADNTLPNTATNYLNIMLIGLITLLASVSIALLKRFKGIRA